MKAIVVNEYGDEDVMKMGETAELIPWPDQLRIRLHTAGVNPVDTYMRAGSQGYTTQLPFTPGFDGAGEVDAVGDRIEGFKPGDRVYVAGSLTGTYGEYCLCSFDQVYPLPREFSWEEGACLGVPYFTAWRGLVYHGWAIPGKTVLIHGATGGVGCACIQLAKSRKVTVFGTAGSDEGEKLIQSMGADKTFNHRDPGRFEAILEATGGRGIDLLLEMVANKNLDGDLKILAPRGRVIIVGSRGPIEITPRDLMGREASIIGMKMIKASVEEKIKAAEGIAEAIDAGFIKPVIAEVLPLEKAPDAHRAILAGGHRGNIVLSIQ